MSNSDRLAEHVNRGGMEVVVDAVTRASLISPWLNMFRAACISLNSLWDITANHKGSIWRLTLSAWSRGIGSKFGIT